MASIEYVVRATDAASAVFGKIAASADGLDKQLGDLSKRIATPSVDLKDAKFTLGMVNAAKRLDALSAKVADPEIKVDGTKAQLEILRISSMLDRLDAKRVKVEAGGGIGGFFKRTSTWRGLAGLLPGVSGAAGGAAGGGAQAAGGAAGGIFSNPYTAIPAVAAGLSALPFLAQAAAGGITLALGGALTGIGVISAAQSKRVRADWTGLFGNAVAELHQVTMPFVGVLKQISQVAQSVLPTVMESLVAPMKILAPAFKIFSDSLLRAFAGPGVAASLLAVAKAFGDIVRALAPQLPGDIADIATGITRIANSISRNAGQFAAIISFFFKATGFALSMVSALANVAGYIEKHFIPALMDIKKGWDEARHQTAVILDGMRHDTAHTWDQIFSNTIGTVIRLAHNVETWFNSLRHEVAVIFDGQRHDIAAAWDSIWHTSLSQVQSGVTKVVIWFNGMPGRILGALRGLGHQLAGFASAAMSEMWNGIKNVGSGILGWFGGFVSKIVGFFARLLHHSPTGEFYFMGKNMMEGLANGIKDHAHMVASAAKAASAIGGVAGPGGGAPAANAALAHRMYASQLTPASWAAWNAVAMRESGWSQFARNASSGAYGIAQALPPTKYPFAAQAAGGSNPMAQISWMWNYMAQRYGGPLGAEAHELSAGWYDRGGWLPTGLSLALNTTGAPERVGGVGGNTYVIHNHVAPNANMADVGRVTVEAIKEYERRSGSRWRS